MKKRNQTLKKQLKTPQKASKPLKKPLYGGFLPLTGPDAKCGSILRRAHFLSPSFC